MPQRRASPQRISKIAATRRRRYFKPYADYAVFLQIPGNAARQTEFLANWRQEGHLVSEPDL